MPDFSFGARSRARLLGALMVTAMGALGSSRASAQNYFAPGELLVSASTYAGTDSTIVIGQTVLPASGNKAIASGLYGDGSTANFTENDNADSNFGITSPFSLIEVNPTTGNEDLTFNVTATTGMVTSFTSKSEGSLNLSSDGTAVTFMGYDSTINQLDISNSNTPGDLNGATTAAPNTYRAISQINSDGTGSLTDVNDYAGDNPRAAILASNGSYYMVGNTGDTSTNANLYTGAQIVTPHGSPTNFANSTSLGSYNITQNGDPADKLPKDNNFRGETIFNNTLYVSKGSGSNGIDTVYQVGTAGTLPTGTGNTISVLPGFNTKIAKNDDKNTVASDFPHPFGIWFANATTLYVADEGSGIFTDIAKVGDGKNDADGQEYAGLDKYSLVNGTWVLDYVLNLGLNIGTSYIVSGTTPGNDSGTYTVESTGGLRDITGKVNGDGTVTVYAITATDSTNYDQGADPNKLVKITDTISYTTASQASSESFATLQTAVYGQVLRGVSFTPQIQATDTPTMPVWGLLLLGVLLIFVATRFLPRQSSRLSVEN